VVKRKGDRRRIERRAPQRGVNVRHDDERPEETKRIKRGRYEAEIAKEKKKASEVNSRDLGYVLIICALLLMSHQIFGFP
jgi:hypothetical protein